MFQGAGAEVRQESCRDGEGAGVMRQVSHWRGALLLGLMVQLQERGDTARVPRLWRSKEEV